MPPETQPQPAGLGRRLMSIIYECMLLFAIAFCSSLPFHGATDGPMDGWIRHLYQLYLFLVFGLYFLWNWVRGGQTLPMKTWKLRLVNSQGRSPGPRQACIRYVTAWLSVLAFGTGFLWAVFDRDRQFLHDRIAGTRIVSANDS